MAKEVSGDTDSDWLVSQANIYSLSFLGGADLKLLCELVRLIIHRLYRKARVCLREAHKSSLLGQFIGFIYLPAPQPKGLSKGPKCEPTSIQALRPH